jgi:hypothetical protein
MYHNGREKSIVFSEKVGIFLFPLLNKYNIDKKKFFEHNVGGGNSEL